MKTRNYDMFTEEGNLMVGRIVEAGRNLRMSDSDEQVWTWTQHELRKLSRGSFMKDGVEHTFGEATDTAVREMVYDALGVDLS